ncbi:hypothetical protein T484DRAFT_1862336 [Baffinella frigidus]|nr:hypothetical protein T484DRAFT_1862336 [Cryptophyta sp. CCMP2293]
MRRGVSAGGGRGVGFEDERPPRRPQSGTGQGEQRSRLKSPYSLSLTPRDLTGAHGGDLEGPSSLATRAVYLQVPQPKEYRQLRSRSSYERGSFDVLPDSARRLRSARPRMQVGSGGDDERAPAGYDSLAGDAYEDKGTYLGSDGRELHSQGVSSWGGGAAAPPQPSMQDPSPRRRSTLPPTPVPADSWAGQRTGPAGAGAVDGGLRRGQMLRELAPVIQAIAGLTHETNLGKLVRQCS